MSWNDIKDRMSRDEMQDGMPWNDIKDGMSRDEMKDAKSWNEIQEMSLNGSKSRRNGSTVTELKCSDTISYANGKRENECKLSDNKPHSKTHIHEDSASEKETTENENENLNAEYSIKSERKSYMTLKEDSGKEIKCIKAAATINKDENASESTFLHKNCDLDCRLASEKKAPEKKKNENFKAENYTESESKDDMALNESTVTENSVKTESKVDISLNESTVTENSVEGENKDDMALNESTVTEKICHEIPNAKIKNEREIKLSDKKSDVENQGNSASAIKMQEKNINENFKAEISIENESKDDILNKNGNKLTLRKSYPVSGVLLNLTLGLKTEEHKDESSIESERTEARPLKKVNVQKESQGITDKEICESKVEKSSNGALPPSKDRMRVKHGDFVFVSELDSNSSAYFHYNSSSTFQIGKKPGRCHALTFKTNMRE